MRTYLCVGDVDKVWLTCCGLYSWLVEIDGYDVPYDGITQSSNPSFSDLTTEDIPFALRRLNDVTIDDIADLSGMGEGTDTTSLNNINVADNEDVSDFGKSVACDITGTNVVRNLSFELFCRKLVIHFDIKYRKIELEWPVQNQSIVASTIGV